MARPLKPLTLFSGEIKPTSFNKVQATHRDEVRGKYLWLALTFPNLPLRAVVKKSTGPTAIAEMIGSQCRILIADPSAQALGIVRGLKLNAGYALAPNLIVYARDVRREARLLEFLASWARRFTSMVSLEMPDTLLLEVGGSLRLFGGLRALQDRLQQSLKRWYLDCRCAVAPFPRAALWIARGGGSSVPSADKLVSHLSGLPLTVTGWPGKTIKLLNEMGVATVGDCLRLPRDGLARRLGSEYLLDLDRVLGKQSDPKSSFLPPQRLTATLQLSGEVEHAAQLQEAGDQMLKELGLALQRRQAAVQEIGFSFHHVHHADTLVRLATLESSHSAERFSRLLKNRLENTVLPAPVTALSLRSGRLLPLKASTGSLFSKPGGSGGSNFAELIECLRNRFGSEAVYGLCLVPEHRPESAWIKIGGDLGRAKDAPRLATSRPLWMLKEPAPLVVTPGGPCYEGVLSLEQGPERIETGWWDGRDVARDYFHARNPFGMSLWIYRQRRGHRGWYLHGIFG